MHHSDYIRVYTHIKDIYRKHQLACGKNKCSWNKRPTGLDVQLAFSNSSKTWWIWWIIKKKEIININSANSIVYHTDPLLGWIPSSGCLPVHREVRDRNKEPSLGHCQHWRTTSLIGMEGMRPRSFYMTHTFLFSLAGILYRACSLNWYACHSTYS